MAGNISPAALDVLRERSTTTALPQAWVLELSSFQLHTTHSLRADAATVLNVTQDHLDWHGDIDAYAAATRRASSARSTMRVLNRDDARVMQMALAAGCDRSRRFGSRRARQATASAWCDENGMQWLSSGTTAARAKSANEAPPQERSGDAAGADVKRLMPADALQIRGRHNAVNALAALALCRAIGLPLAPLLHGLREYRGEPHRVELVAHDRRRRLLRRQQGHQRRRDGRRARTASARRRRSVLIAGGDGKGQDFAPLAEPVAR